VKVSYFEHFWPKIPMVKALFFLCHFWPSMQTVKVFVVLSHFWPRLLTVKVFDFSAFSTKDTNGETFFFLGHFLAKYANG